MERDIRPLLENLLEFSRAIGRERNLGFTQRRLNLCVELLSERRVVTDSDEV